MSIMCYTSDLAFLTGSEQDHDVSGLKPLYLFQWTFVSPSVSNSMIFYSLISQSVNQSGRGPLRISLLYDCTNFIFIAPFSSTINPDLSLRGHERTSTLRQNHGLQHHSDPDSAGKLRVSSSVEIFKKFNCFSSFLLFINWLRFSLFKVCHPGSHAYNRGRSVA